MTKFEGDIGDPVSVFENDNGIIEIRDEKNGIFLFRVNAGEILKDDELCHKAIAQALSWWREQTHAKIVSIAGLDGDETSWPSLIVVTEQRERGKSI